MIDSYFRSDIGKNRANNEDSSGAFEPQSRRELIQSGRLYVVADGMGGHEQGEKASAYAVETLLKVYYQAPEIPPEKRLRDIIKQINQNLVAYAEKNLPRGEKTGTTLVAAVVRKGKLLVANVGDSRAYLLRDGSIKQITRDHTFVGELVRAGTITEEEARESKYRNRLSRSVGADSKLEVDIHTSIPLRRGDMVLLCTDGLTNYASSQDILNAAHGSPKEIAERLIRFANDRGGSDNVTVSVIKYGEKFSLPFALPIRKIALVGAGLLILAAFVFLGRFGASLWTDYLATSTPTATFTYTPSPSPTASPSTTSTPEMTETIQPTNTETAKPVDSPEPPASVGLVDCDYLVIANDNVEKIAGKFGITSSQIFRQDGTQENMRLIFVGETLIIRGISNEACMNGGGIIRSEATGVP